MGNSGESPHNNLRDYETEIQIPSNLSRFTSNMVLANFHGDFAPCMILGQSTKMPDGYRVYFFHNQEEAEVPSRSILGNLKILKNCEISFLDDKGLIRTGYVRGSDWRNSDTGTPLNFFVCRSDTKECVWVSLPYVFLNKVQAGKFYC